eukprot:TRINITY_DN72530_c0_g1_i1.p1 TRINITY_DN72530_c0_g1~~TRINITY_DN72530_c0_g1_i1.p1  ORF type:complete len:386 (-),score=92.32 TRINITY_DN72530_c0_g1_i1:136-1152(-)
MAAFADVGTDASGAVQEHRLEWTQLHADYRALYDAQIRELLSREGFEVSEVEALCHSVSAGQPGGGALASFLQALTASEDYEAFVGMMRRGTAPWVDPESTRKRMLTLVLNALEEPRFVNIVSNFVVANHGAFKCTLDSGTEHRLDWTRIHNEYNALYEEHVTQVLARHHFGSMDLLALVSEVRAAGSAEADAALDSCLALFSGSTDYLAFVSMMKRVVVVAEQTSPGCAAVAPPEEPAPVPADAAAGGRSVVADAAAGVGAGAPADAAAGTAAAAAEGKAESAQLLGYERRLRPPRKLPPLFSLLPPGWGTYETAEGHTYYANAETGESRWERPVNA